MTDPGVRLAILKAVKGEIEAAEKQAKQDWADALEKLTKPSIDGVQLTSIWQARGRTDVQIVNEPLFTRWVEEHYPTEIETVRRVRSSFINAIVEKSREAGEPCTPDGTSQIPGVEYSEGDPSVSVRKPGEEALRLIVDLHERGFISLNGEVLKEIEG